MLLEYVGYISQRDVVSGDVSTRQQFSVCVGNEIPARACPVQPLRARTLVNGIGRQEFRTAPLSRRIKAD